MAEMIKYKAEEIAFHIRHDLREIPAGKYHGNESIDPELTCNNYSLIDRGNAAKQNAYRKELEKEIYKYNRSNLIHAVEWCIQCPADCPEEQKGLFFQEAYNYVVSTLPMGERCVIVSEVHTDERHYSPTGELLSKDHLHIIFVPGVPDTKHAGYEWKLCANDLTDRKHLKAFHPGLQKHLNSCGIHATVYAEKDGRNIALSVKQLKEITAKTGITFDHPITVQELGHIIEENAKLKELIRNQEKEINTLKEQHASHKIEREWSSSNNWGYSHEWDREERERLW